MDTNRSDSEGGMSRDTRKLLLLGATILLVGTFFMSSGDTRSDYPAGLLKRMAPFMGFYLSGKLAVLFTGLLLMMGFVQSRLKVHGLVKGALFVYVFLFITAVFGGMSPTFEVAAQPPTMDVYFLMAAFLPISIVAFGEPWEEISGRDKHRTLDVKG